MDTPDCASLRSQSPSSFFLNAAKTVFHPSIHHDTNSENDATDSLTRTHVTGNNALLQAVTS